MNAIVNPSDELAVSVRHLSHTCGATRVLDDFSMDLTRGEHAHVVGRAGAGKTTLLNHLFGLLRPQSGAVRVFSKDPVTEPEAVRTRIAYVPQVCWLPGEMSLEALEQYDEPYYPTWDADWAAELRKRFRLDGNRRVRDLGPEDRLRVAMLLALARRPDLLIIDNDFITLDAVARDELRTAFGATFSDPPTLITTSRSLNPHDTGSRDWGRLILLDQGKSVLRGDFEEFLAAHHHFDVGFDPPRMRFPDLEGVLGAAPCGRWWRVLFFGDPAVFSEAMRSLGGEPSDPESVDPDEIYRTRLGKRA